MPEVSSDILNHFKGFCTTPSVIMLFVYMKCRFSLSYRELEEMMSIRVANVTIQPALSFRIFVL
jgi:transposase-like protein